MKPAPRAHAACSRLWVVSALVYSGCNASANARVEPDRAIPGVTVDAPCVEQRCQEGLSCRLIEREGAGVGVASERCVLEPGRCRDDWDCSRSVQRCRRFGTRLGVCQDSGL